MIASANSKEGQRQEAYQKRLRVHAAEAKQACHKMMENFLRDVPLQEGAVIAGYWPVHGEINVMPLLVQLQHKGYACALPQIKQKGAPLGFRSWNEKMLMRQNAYEMKEPDPAHSTAVRPDIVIVPLLAFDAACHRLGYGLGFYDLTLKQLRAQGPVLAVGVAYDVQKIKQVAAESQDARMDIIVTEKSVYKA